MKKEKKKKVSAAPLTLFRNEYWQILTALLFPSAMVKESW